MNRLLKGVCMIEDCPSIDQVYSRGLCTGHYSMMRRLVQLKRRTWQEFEDYEMALPRGGRGGGIKRKIFEKMLEKKANEKL